MKLPNFRLYQTQAVAGLLLGIVGIGFVVAMSFVTFRTFDSQQKVIWYNPNASGLAGAREELVLLCGGLAALVGVIGGVMGFNSLGQKRNERQGFSWLGLALGAFSFTAALVVLFAWQRLKEEIIK